MKLMIVDDSLTYRLILKEILRHIPETEIVATATHGQDALQKLAELSGQVDLMLLDLQMPVMDGMQTLDAMREQYPHVNVVVVSGLNVENADLTIRALEKGAIDFIRKPDHAEADENFEELLKQMEFIVASCKKKNSSKQSPVSEPRLSTLPAQSQTRRAPVTRHKDIQVVTIGISTGGPAALSELIPNLPARLNVPILIVQHMPPLFTRSLADSLQAKSALRVVEAAADDILEPGTVYIAPGGNHMAVRTEHENTRIYLPDLPPEHSCKPAVDVLFRSVEQVYGGNTLAIIMTGMGNDGALGMQILKKSGAYCISQTAESCVIYGMPRAVDEMGLPDEHVSLADMPNRITQLVCKGQ